LISALSTELLSVGTEAVGETDEWFVDGVPLPVYTPLKIRIID